MSLTKTTVKRFTSLFRQKVEAVGENLDDTDFRELEFELFKSAIRERLNLDWEWADRAFTTDYRVGGHEIVRIVRKIPGVSDSLRKLVEVVLTEKRIENLIKNVLAFSDIQREFDRRVEYKMDEIYHNTIARVFRERVERDASEIVERAFEIAVNSIEKRE